MHPGEAPEEFYALFGQPRKGHMVKPNQPTYPPKQRHLSALQKYKAS